ncbi:MAG: transglycosylase SLT domain-containing protein, partial [Elusimicrobia bacterium]|nr:transglycosylase SLT domain-containing protein [Elusimicrobiota bacterium]
AVPLPRPAPPRLADVPLPTPRPALEPDVPMPEQRPAAVRDASPKDCSPLRGRGRSKAADMDEIIAQESVCTGVDASVIKALIAAQDGGRSNPLIVTRAAADWVGVRGDLRDPRTSIRAGALYLAKLVRFFHGDLHRALAAYQAGIGAVIRSGGIPNRRSVKDLLARFEAAYRVNGTHPVDTVLPPEHATARQLEESAKAVLTGTPKAPNISFSATARFRKSIEAAAQMYGVDPALIEAVILSESDGNVREHSSAGAKGLMQLMPDTARAMGVRHPYDPAENIQGGTRYLKSLIDRFGGNVILGVAAYNAGPNRRSLERGRIPTIRQTVNYVTRVFTRYSQLSGTRMEDVTSLMTSRGKAWYRREKRRLDRLWSRR